MKVKLYSFLLAALYLPALLQAQTINDLAGNDTSGYSGDGGQAIHAELDAPEGVCADPAGNIYIADLGNYVVRKVSACEGNTGDNVGSCGVIVTYAGNYTQHGYSGDGGPATAAGIGYEIWGVAADKNSNLYICDGNYVVRKVDTSGIITTFAGNNSQGYSGDGGPATAASFVDPANVGCDAAGNVYICDVGSNVIRKVNTAGIISTFAGNGTAGYSGDGGPSTAAQLNGPFCIAFDKYGNSYIADWSNNVVRKIDTAGIIHTIAGTPGVYGYTGDGGPATAATFSFQGMGSVAVDSAGNIFIADSRNHVIRRIDTSGIISTYAGNGQGGFSGNGGPALDAEFESAQNIAVDKNGNLYIADVLTYEVRVVSKYTTSVSSVSNNQENTLKIYPSPSDGNFTIDFVSQDNEPVTITVINAFGEKVAEYSIHPNQPFPVTLNSAPGIYVVNAIVSGKIYRTKLVIVK